VAFLSEQFLCSCQDPSAPAIRLLHACIHVYALCGQDQPYVGQWGRLSSGVHSKLSIVPRARERFQGRREDGKVQACGADIGGKHSMPFCVLGAEEGEALQG
jgi:hypothetical protein